MRKTRILAGALLAAPLVTLSAQSVRWNDTYQTSWQDQAPRVRVAIMGDRNVALGAPVMVQFEVSEDAYVTVARVDANGRLTILYPSRRGARAAVKGGQLQFARSPDLGYQGSFVATDRRVGGYVFALASFVPLDLSGFENRDFDRFGGYSQFTQVNRSIASRPEVLIERFAQQVLWEASTPYDFDVDYYYPWGSVTPFNAYALCGAVSRYGYGPIYPRSILQYDWDNWDMYTGRSYNVCADFYRDVHCVSLASVFGYGSCFSRPLVAVVGYQPQPLPGPTEDGAVVPNKGVVMGGLVTPVPVPVAADPGNDPPPLERIMTFDAALRGGTPASWDSFLSIPSRAAQRLKGESGPDKGPAGVSRDDETRRAPTFDRAVGAGGRSRVADAGSEPPARVQPSRDAVKTKRTGSTGRTTGTTGTGASSSRDRGDVGRATRSRPATTTPAPRPTPTIQSTGSSTTKTKPPGNPD
jgi:hypothetical protein